MKCKECGQYDALQWSKHGFCLRCWLKSDEPPAANQELEIVEDDYDVYENEIRLALDAQDPPLDMPWLWQRDD